MRLLCLLGFVLGACGARQVPAGESPRCVASTAEARAAWVRAAERATPVEAEMERAEPTALERAIERLERHAASLRRAPEEVAGEVALELSGVVMDAIDEVASAIPRRVRDRAETAAEALLTDRGAEDSIRAARAAALALEAVIEHLAPEVTAAMSMRRAVARFRARAESAAEGYADDARRGDRRADRAEAAPLSDVAGVDETILAARAEAIRASASTRMACGFARTLSVPSI